MFKKLLLYSCLALSFATARAAYVPVTLTGFTTDVVANGNGPAGSSTTNRPAATVTAVLLGNYSFMAPDFNPTAATPAVTPTSFLPASGVVNSAATPGLSYQLQSYTGNNAVFIANAGIDSVVFATPRTAGEVFVLNTSADGTSTVTMTINFTDGSTQAFVGQLVNDWYNATTGIAILGLGRANIAAVPSGQIGNDASNPRLYENKLTLLPANYAKLIRSIRFDKTSSGAEYVVMGVSVNTVCTGAPVAGTVTASGGTSACPGINFSLSLSGSNAAIGTTYQWQSSPTGTAPWSNLGTASTQTVSQTVTTSYRAFITCSGGPADTSAAVQVTMKPVNQCYCTPTYTSGGGGDGITNITLGTLNNTSPATNTSPYYTDYTPQQPATIAIPSIVQTLTYTVSVAQGTDGTQYSGVWIDFNQDGTFGTTEYFSLGTNAGASGTSLIPITVPVNALPGNTRMRIRGGSDALLQATTPCGAASSGFGEAEDYLVNIVALTPCTGSPTGGTAASSVTNACPGVAFNLTSSGATIGSGITYQWQSSPTGSAPWTNITGAIASSYSTTQASPTSYRLKVTCNAIDSAFSTIVAVGQNLATQCYCIPVATNNTYFVNNFTTTGAITNVANASGAGTTGVGYSNFTNIAINGLTGSTISFTSTFTGGTFGARIYVDWNQNGVLNDAGEQMFTTTSYVSSISGSFVVPTGALSGNTRLRIIIDFNASGGQVPCGPYAFGSGEAEDYTFVVIPNVPCAAPTAQASSLILTPGVTTVSGSFTAAVPAADKYLVLRTPGTATPSVAPSNTVTYTAGASLGNATVISTSSSLTFADANAAPSTQYRYTIYSYNDLCVGAPVYNVTTPLSGTVTTNGVTVYTWNGFVNTDWQTAANWTPNRNVTDASDVLQFNNGIVDSVTNIPTQTIGRLTFTNNTTATFKAQTGATRVLTIKSDNSPANELDIAAGSSLISNGTANVLTIKYSGTAPTGRIAGNLEVSNTGTVTNTIDFSNATDTVTATGSLIAGGTVNSTVFTSTAANLVVNGNYIHRYTTVGGGAVPTAVWGPASQVLIAGYTTATGGPSGGLGQTFTNFTYNAPAQTAIGQWSGTLPTTVNGTLSVVSTGSGQWQWSATTGYTVTVNNFEQTGGTIDLGTSTGAKTLNVAGNFNEQSGILKVTGTGAVTLNFNGNTVAQNVALFDSSITGPVIYRVSNPFGINLSGTGLLSTTPVFKINTGGGVQISSTAANPVNTAMTLTYFATGTTLTYDGSASQVISPLVWPTANGPLNVTINNSGATLNNQVLMPGSRTMAATAVLTIGNGVLALGSSNLTISNTATGAISISTPSATRMIAADGIGQLLRGIATANTTYLFPVGDQTGTAEYSPVSLNTTSTGTRLMGIRVVNAHHPNDASASYLNRYWVFTDTATSTYTYTGNFAYTTADISGTEATLRLSGWNGTVWAQIPSLAATNVLTIQGTQSSAFRPLGGQQITGRTAENSNVYVWNGSVGTDYQVAANWTPSRNIPDPGDFLVFNNNIVDTVKNIPTQIISRLTFSGTTTGVFQTGAANTLTFMSDNIGTTNELDIAAGAALISNGTSPLTLAFSGTGGTANIAGLLESVSNAVNNVFNFTNAVATVTATGTLAEGGSNGNSAVTGTTAANLQVNGLFNYKYTVVTVAFPLGSFNTGSTMLISGYTTVTGGPNGNQNQPFYNFTYNCPNQTAAANWSGTGALNVSNNLTVISTGTGSWQYAGGQGFNALIGNYIQTGGTFNLSSAAASGAQVFNVSGNFNQTGGTFTATGASSGANAPTLHFNGTGSQDVNFFNAAPVGPITYRVSNPNGINLTGTGTLTATFAINSNGGVRISSSAANPVNTTLALTYAATATTLTYDPSSPATATASVWPATAGPLNVTINSGGSVNLITVPFSRTIAGTLTMASGDLSLNSITLTLGTAAATPGTLAYTAGNIRVTTGTFNRWFGITGLPTATGTGIGFFPIASVNGANRNVAVYFSAGSITTGGTIAAGHTDASGFTTVSVVDPLPTPYTITTRTNASWNFTSTGFNLGATTIGMRVNGTGLLTSSNPANLRLMHPAAVVGTHIAGAGVSAQRAGLLLADLTSPYHIGANGADINGTYIAVNTGNWSNPTTWQNNLVPGVTNEAFINPGVTVTADAATNMAKALTILPGGILTASAVANTVTIDSALQNNGQVNLTGGNIVVNGNNGLSGVVNNSGATFNVASGTARLGATGGSNKPFINNGILSVSGGLLNVNGNLQLVNGSTLNQSGGNISVDGNAGGVVANSVLTGTPIINILTPNLNLTGGTFTVVDPHVGASTNTFVYNNAANVNAGGSHTFVAGNGTSTDTGFNAAYGMSVNANVGTGKLAFMNVIANSGTAANSWLVFGAANTGILGNFTINAGAEHRQGGTGNTLYLAGNLVNNGIYSALGTTYFGNYFNGTASSNLAAQTVSGAGTFRNLLTTPTGKFYKIQVNNNFNVTFNIGDVPFSNNVTLTASTAPAPVGPSRIIMQGTSILSELAGASFTGAGATSGWIVGRYQKAAGTIGGFNGTFPIGDLINYAPVGVGAATVATTGAIWAGTTTGDHPALGSANLVSSKSVNRYYTMTPVNGLTFTGGATVTFNWTAADVDAGANTAAFAIGKYAAAAWTYPAVATTAATAITSAALVVDLNVAGDFAVGELCSPINISTQPVPTLAACLGSPATFSIGLTGASNVSYQWQKGTTNIPGANSATYTIPAVAATDAGTYRVIISSLCASVATVTSAVTTLNINTPAAITTQPTAQNVCEGSPVTFNVAATGTGITYQWQRNGTDIAGATTNSYSIPVAGYSDTATYTVKITGTAPCGFITSAAAPLTIKALPLTITASGPVNFCPGGSVALCASSTPATLTYVWRQNGSPLAGQTSACYTATTSATYTAQITNTANGCSNISNPIAVSVNGAPQSTITPAGTAAFCQGGNIVLRGLSTPGLTYEWYLNGNTATVLSTDSLYTATTAGSYTLKVSIGSGCATISTPTVVTVNPLPTITTTPTGASALCQNDSLAITALFNNATLQWRLNGAPITGATGNTYYAKTAGNFTVTATNTATGCVNTSAPVTVTINPLPTVTVTSVNAATFCAGGSDTLRAAPVSGLSYVWNRAGVPVTPAATASEYVATTTGVYTVTVTNVNGCKATSNSINVIANPLPAVVITPSLGLAICQGQSNNLCVPAAAGITYQWRNNATNIPGATSACYAASAAGSYSVVATNTATGCTATSANAAITVNAVPVATITPPASTTACIGDTICLNANTGSNLSYQWQVNSNPIVGATLATHCATVGGTYTVVVTNGSNCATISAPVVMTFNPRPTATITYTTPITFCEGGAVVLTGVSNTGNAYQWQNNGGSITGANSSSYIASSTGNYSVIITNGFGCSTVSIPVIVVANALPQPQITRTGGILATGSYASYQWYLNSQTLAGETNQSVNALQNGGYAVRVIDANGCTNYSGVTFVNNVGIGNNPAISPAAVTVFPNPVHKLVYIDAPGQVNVVLRDLTGRTIQKEVNVTQVDMTGLPDGYYMLMITDKNGVMIKAEKVMKVAE